MKRIFHKLSLIASLWVLWMLWFATSAQASGDLDRLYALETIGFIRSWDNVEGVFADTVAAVYKDYFSKLPRFSVNDLSKADFILTHSKIPYPRVIRDPQVLSQLARSTRTESIIRTEIMKEGSQYFFTLEWLRAPQMDEIASIRFTVDEPSNGEAFNSDFIHKPLTDHLNQLFSQVPFIGHVTGRDQGMITINLGRYGRLKKGDTVVIATLDEVKKHPLMKRIVDWKLTPIGKAVVEQVDEGISFCKVIEEESNQIISRFQKVIQVQPGLVQEEQPKEATGSTHFSYKSPDNSIPKVGSFSFTLPVGPYQWQLSSTTPQALNTGGGLALGVKAEGQIWLTRDWFVDLGVGYSFWNFTQTDSQTGVSSPASTHGGVSASMLSMKIDFGYTYSFNNYFVGPKGWLKLGYKSQSLSLPTSITPATGATTAEMTGPVSFGSVFAGVGGSLPVRNQWGLMGNLNMRIFSMVNASWLDSATSASDVEFSVAGTYRMSTRIAFAFGFEILASNASFLNGGEINQKTVTFGPSFLYYF